MRRTGDPQGAPRIDGEQANACAKGCDACVARAAREGTPRIDGEQANACAKGDDMNVGNVSAAPRWAVPWSVFVLAVVAAVTGGCATVQVGSDYDKSPNFAN